MTLTIVVRDTLEALGAQVSQKPGDWLPFRGTGGMYLELSFQSRLQYIFGLGWARQWTQLPVLAPELTHARTWGWQPGGAIERRLDQWTNPTGGAFEAGRKNALFLGLPITLSHLLAFRRYALQGRPSGWTATVGYRLGEVVGIQLLSSGGLLWWGWQTLEPLPLLVGLGLTARVVWDATRNRRAARNQPKTLWRIGGLHARYGRTEQGILLGSLGGQTLEAASQATRLYVGPGSWRAHSRYGLGLLCGGLRRDAFLLAGGLALVERRLFWFRCPPEAWRRTVDQWSTRRVVALARATLPFYTADYLFLGPLGFNGRDTDLSRALSRRAFSVPLPRPNEPVSIQFEGRNVLTTDSFGRTAPDVVRDPWHRAQLAVESVRDGIDETYTTRTSNQRVDAVYLGSLERAVFDWLNRRSASPRASNRDTIPIAEPVRLGLGREVSPAAVSVGDADRLAGRLERWYRAARGRRADSYAVNLPLERSQGHPEGLTALYHTGLEAPRYLAGGGLVEPFRAIRYDSPNELSRKRNARRSPLHRAPVHAYRDWLRSRQPREGRTSSLQQQSLYRARLALGDYLSACRRYAEAERGPRGWEVNRRISTRGVWQRELRNRSSGGVRSRASTVYSQQYTGNLHLARRLFSISWDRRENRRTRSSSPNTNLPKTVRRKLALDQLTLQRSKALFEHEELGRVQELRVRNGSNRLLASVDPSTRSKRANEDRSGQWVLLPGGVSRPDRAIHPQPLYAGWDNERRSLVLCNRYLPAEQAVRNGILAPSLARSGQRAPSSTDIFSTPAARSLADQNSTASLRAGETRRARFAVWPRNGRTRRRRTVNTRYTSRAFLSRRRPACEVALLARDRARWAQGAAGSPSVSQFAFWLNPRSDSRRNPLDLTPTRSAQAFPLAFERSARRGVYSPGEIQPSNRGGLVWLGTDRNQLLPANYYRPGAPRETAVSGSLILLSKGKWVNIPIPRRG